MLPTHPLHSCGTLAHSLCLAPRLQVESQSSMSSYLVWCYDMLGSWPALLSSFALHLEPRPPVATPTSIRNSVYLFIRSPLPTRTCHRPLRQACSVWHLRKRGCINASIICFYVVGSLQRMISYLCYVCIFISLPSTLGSSATKQFTWCSDRVMFVSFVSRIPYFKRVCAHVFL